MLGRLHFGRDIQHAAAMGGAMADMQHSRPTVAQQCLSAASDVLPDYASTVSLSM
jgi:hypothetical protein